MFKRFVLALAVLCAGPAQAVAFDAPLLSGSSAPWWVSRGTVPATLDYNFAQGLYYQQGKSPGQSPANLITVSRASTGYAADTSGNWTSFANNVARITNQGLLVEESRTNVVLWNRDLTNAAWTKSSTTAALDQTGIDGTTNSASSLTATAGNGTALQSITLASSARWQSAFVKRITGSGAVNMTMDNGATWTAIAVTNAWTRVEIPTQTLANPTVGFQIVTNGDKIAVDFVQNENGAFATSPILDTTTAGTRAADVIVNVSPGVFGNAYTMVLRANPQAPNSYGTAQFVASIDDGTLTNRLFIRRVAGAANVGNVSGGVEVDPNPTGTWNQSTNAKIAAATQASDQAATFNGGALATTAGALPIGVREIYFGSRGGAFFLNGTISRATFWLTTRQPNGVLQGLTQ